MTARPPISNAAASNTKHSERTKARRRLCLLLVGPWRPACEPATADGMNRCNQRRRFGAHSPDRVHTGIKQGTHSTADNKPGSI